MSVPLFRAYADQLAPLEAAELLDFTTAIAVGTGSVKKGTSKRIMADWKRTANRGVATRRVQTVEEIRALMATVTG